MYLLKEVCGESEVVSLQPNTQIGGTVLHYPQITNHTCAVKYKTLMRATQSP